MAEGKVDLRETQQVSRDCEKRIRSQLHAFNDARVGKESSDRCAVMKQAEFRNTNER